MILLEFIILIPLGNNVSKRLMEGIHIVLAALVQPCTSTTSSSGVGGEGVYQTSIA